MDSSERENGQAPVIWPFGPCAINVRLKNTTIKNDANTRDATIFLSDNDMFVVYIFFVFRRSELPTTETDDIAIANPAKAGLRSHPNIG